MLFTLCTANDRWHEFSLSPEATFVQLKIPILRHWKILPDLSSLAINSNTYTDGSTKAQHLSPQTSATNVTAPASIRGTPAGNNCRSSLAAGGKDLSLGASKPTSRRASLLSSVECPASSTSVTKTHLQPHTDFIRECARIMASYSFRSVSCGCFLPDDAVLAKRCVQYDILIASAVAIPDNMALAAANLPSLCADTASTHQH